MTGRVNWLGLPVAGSAPNIRALRDEAFTDVQQHGGRSTDQPIGAEPRSSWARPTRASSPSRGSRGSWGSDFTNLLDKPPTRRRSRCMPPATTCSCGPVRRAVPPTCWRPPPSPRSADLWLWRLVPGDTYRGQADPARSQELFYVLAGVLTLTADDQEVVVPAAPPADCAATASTRTTMQARSPCSSSAPSRSPLSPQSQIGAP